MSGSAKAVEVLGAYIAQLEQQLTQAQQVIANQQGQIDELKQQVAPADVTPASP